MDRIKALSSALYTAAVWLWVFPALALAQAAPSQPVQAPANSGEARGGNWLWIIAALVVLAIIWWAMSSRRRGTVTR
jgi:hypothetical protein